MSKPKEPPAPTTQVVERRDESPHFIVPTQSTPLSQCPSTIDISTEDGKCRFLAATGVSDILLDPTKPLEIDVTDYIVYPVSKVDDETGEESEYIRTVLISKEGLTFATSSPVVLNRLQAIVQLWGPGWWHPPITCIIVARVGRKSGRLFHDMRVKPRE